MDKSMCNQMYRPNNWRNYEKLCVIKHGSQTTKEIMRNTVMIGLHAVPLTSFSCVMIIVFFCCCFCFVFEAWKLVVGLCTICLMVSFHIKRSGRDSILFTKISYSDKQETLYLRNKIQDFSEMCNKRIARWYFWHYFSLKANRKIVNKNSVGINFWW